jgi:uncharacterized lipoprotein YddW (UPF0748 family)
MGGSPALGQGAAPLAPRSPREFRAAWVATVGNSTWPSERNLSVDEQKKEMLAILDRAVELRLNAIIFQVRTQCDALYESKLEPWSEFLTGTEGKPPEPYYDPLALWITEAHRRGLELHAWFNPYRARSGSADGERAANHVSRTKPQIVRTYGNQLWLDPGDPGTIEHSVAVFMDVVKRYDIDGVHIDDYFYPYKITEPIPGASTTATTAPRANGSPAASPRDLTPATSSTTRPSRRWRRGNSTQPSVPRRSVDFPDDATWTKYQQSGGKLSRNDWRRQNVNTLIEKLYTSIKREKVWVKFGISPFGIWKPGNPPGIEGLNAYDQLYADSRLWLSRGWCDYFTPQLYWGNEGSQAYPALFNWWTAQNDSRRYIWPGIAVGRRDPNQTIAQIMITRKTPNPGNVHWSARSLMNNKALCDALLAGPYEQQALIPASTWLDSTPPGKPQATAQRAADGAVTIAVAPAAGEAPTWYSVHARYGTKWKFSVHPASAGTIKLDKDAKLGEVGAIVVGSVDRCGNESERVTASIAAR